MGEVRLPLVALECKGAASAPALSPSAGQRGISAHSRSTTEVEVESVLSQFCFPKSGMSDPSRSAIFLIWECLGEMPGSPDLLPISVPSLDTEGPLMLPRLPRAQGAGCAARLE